MAANNDGTRAEARTQEPLGHRRPDRPSRGRPADSGADSDSDTAETGEWPRRTCDMPDTVSAGECGDRMQSM